MAEYSKKTVAELTEILKSRGLPHSGKKAELIARLQENDKEAEAAAAPAAPEATDIAPPEPTAEPEPAPIQNEPASTEPSAPVENTAETTSATPAISYALNLPTSTVDSELAKRKARAERFGTGSTAATNTVDAAVENTPQAASDTEAIKALERAKRFGINPESGTGNTAISKLDEALPSERIRGSKRKADNEATSTLDDPGLKRGFGGRGGRGRGGRFAHRNRGGGGGMGRNPGSKPQGITKGQPPAYTSDRDRAAAEARKKKFATA